MTDQQIILGCKQHEPTAYKALLEKYAPLLMAIGMRYLKSKEKAEDVLQDSYISIFNSIDKYNEEGNLKGWLTKIVVNNCLKVLRIKKVIVQLEETHMHESYESFIVENLEAADILKILEILPDHYLVIFNLFVIEGYSHKEISDLLEISESSSRVYLTRARSAIKNYFIKTKVC